MPVWTVRGGIAGPRGAPARNVLAIKELTNATVQMGAATGKHQLATGFLRRCSRVLRQGGKGRLLITLGTSAQLAHRQPARKSA
jgi:hypothetical protein